VRVTLVNEFEQPAVQIIEEALFLGNVNAP
jgi:hypothetical protein